MLKNGKNNKKINKKPNLSRFMGGVTLPTASADLHAVTVHFFSRENSTELLKKVIQFLANKKRGENMNKKRLDTLMRKGIIYHKGKSFIELGSRKKMFENFCKDEIALEKIIKSHKEKLKSIVFYGIETPKELEEKKNRINRITRDLEVRQQALENLRTEKTEFLKNRNQENQVFYKEYEKEFRENFSNNEKQKEIDNSYLDLLGNLNV